MKRKMDLQCNYFDNAQNACTKPERVYQAMQDGNRLFGSLPCKNSYRTAREAYRSIEEVKEKIKRFMGTGNVGRVFFSSSTFAAHYRILMEMEFKEGDVVCVSPYEPDYLFHILEGMRIRNKITIKEMPVMRNYSIDVEQFRNECRKEPPKCVVCSHVNAVNGYVLPIIEISEVCKEAGCRFIVDVSQSVGLTPIDLCDVHYDFCVFSGCKALQAPIGISVIISKHGFYDQDETNTGLIHGLAAGIDFVSSRPETYEYVFHLRRLLKEGLQKIEGVRIPGEDEGLEYLGMVSFDVKGYRPAEIGMILDEDYNIAVGVRQFGYGYAQKRMGLGEEGLVRASVGALTKESEVRVFLYSIREILGKTGI